MCARVGRVVAFKRAPFYAVPGLALSVASTLGEPDEATRRLVDGHCVFASACYAAEANT